MVRTLIDPGRQQKDWDEQLPFAMLAYRSSIQESTGESPAMMMLGHEISLPVDLLIPSDQPEEENADYAEQLRSHIHDVHHRARNKLKLSGAKQSKTYDRNTQLNVYNVGDWVWLSGVQRKKGICPKLEYKWEGPYLVTHRLSDVVYRIQRSEKFFMNRMMIICHHCTAGFTTRTAYHTHLENSHNIPLTLKCEFCSYETEFQGAMKRHYGKKEGRRANEVRSCELTEASERYLTRRRKRLERKEILRKSRAGEELAKEAREKEKRIPPLTISTDGISLHGDDDLEVTPPAHEEDVLSTSIEPVTVSVEEESESEPTEPEEMQVEETPDLPVAIDDDESQTTCTSLTVE
ncbi:uncharacterized protein LOC135154210 [Lytechinus pictus]|uniref:uncharacterized protein LOC135154210 n=1 Tax=Lytechinus pictus TaxID=7653 RepID=UPI0030B9B242